jgi:hypothetical protein
MISDGLFTYVGLWWVHGLFLGISLLYFMQYSYNLEFNILSSSSRYKKNILIFLLIILSIWLLA